MLRETILNIIANVWPMLLIFITIIVSIRITSILTKKEKFVFYQDVIVLGFIIYILCLFYVVTFQDVSWSSSNFTPFAEMFRFKIGSPMFLRNFFGNMLLFMPYGFFVSYFLDLKKSYIAFILITIASITIECTQLVIGRVFDIDDIILNVIGGLIGYFLYHLLKRIAKHLPNVLKNPIFYNILMVVFLAAMAFILLVWRV